MNIEATFVPDDLEKIGFKKARSYKLEGLPGASDAIFGFWRIASGDPIDYELRFYESHTDAVELGAALADEGSGEDAVLDPDDAQYKEGVKDRRMIVGSGIGGRRPQRYRTSLRQLRHIRKRRHALRRCRRRTSPRALRGARQCPAGSRRRVSPLCCAKSCLIPVAWLIASIACGSADSGEAASSDNAQLEGFQSRRVEKGCWPPTTS